MGDKDSYSKALLSDPVVFADAFNVFLHGGEQVIEPGDLKELDSVELLLPRLFGVDLKAGGYSRDMFKRLAFKSGRESDYVLLGIEEQSHVDYGMPLRVILYDALGYQRQLRQLRGDGRPGHIPSSMRPGDSLKPIVTLVIYLSEEPWDGPVTFREMLSPLPKWLEPFVLDHKLNLLCPHDLTREQIGLFRSDLAAVMTAAKYATDNERLLNEIKTGGIFEKIRNPATLPLIERISTLDFEIQYTEVQEMKKNAMKLSEYIYQKGRDEGIEQGIEKGCILGSITTLQSMQMPFEAICEKMLELYMLTPEQVVNYMKMKQ